MQNRILVKREILIQKVSCKGSQQHRKIHKHVPCDRSNQLADPIAQSKCFLISICLALDQQIFHAFSKGSNHIGLKCLLSDAYTLL